MTYLDLRMVGYHFFNHGALLGDPQLPPGLCWYSILSPDGKQIGMARSSTAALAVAREHYKASRAA